LGQFFSPYINSLETFTLCDIHDAIHGERQAVLIIMGTQVSGIFL